MMKAATIALGLAVWIGSLVAFPADATEEVIWPESAILAKLQEAAGRNLTNQVSVTSSNQPLAVLERERGTSTNSNGYLFSGVAGYRYLAFLPPDYVESTNKYPLILFLHGRSLREDIPALKNYGPIRHMLDRADSRFVVAAPTTADRNWFPGRLSSFLVSFCTRVRRIDSSRIYLTGISMGGYGTWNFATAYPQWLGAIAPLCGGGDPAGVAARLKGPAAWVFHGAKDDVVPLDQSLMLVRALEQNGSKVLLSVFSEAGHDISSMVYTRDDLYNWFLLHRNARLTSPRR